jgi:hypothetical protein
MYFLFWELTVIWPDPVRSPSIHLPQWLGSPWVAFPDALVALGRFPAALVTFDHLSGTVVTFSLSFSLLAFQTGIFCSSLKPASYIRVME